MGSLYNRHKGIDVKFTATPFIIFIRIFQKVLILLRGCVIVVSIANIAVRSKSKEGNMLDLFYSLFSEADGATDMSSAVQIILTVIILAAAVLLVIVNVIVLARDKKKKSLGGGTADNSDTVEVEEKSEAAETAIFETALAEEIEDESETKPDPVSESKTEAKPVEEEAEQVYEGNGDMSVVTAQAEHGAIASKRIFVMYNRSFTAKLIQSDDAVQERYSALKNKLLSYKKVGSRMCWQNDSFRYGRQTVGRFAIRGKTLSLYLALDPVSLENEKYIFEDASQSKRYAPTPVRLKLKSARSVRWAGELIDRMMTGLGAEAGDEKGIDYSMPYETTDALIKRKLIKLLATGDVGTEVVTADFGTLSREKFKVVTGLDIRESVTVTEAAKTVTEEAAEALVIRAEKDEGRRGDIRGNKKTIVNIDTLSKNFTSGDTVDIQSLIDKKIVSRSVGYVKVLARGTLDKPLTVKAQDFSLDAVKMIVMTGGAAVLDE